MLTPEPHCRQIVSGEVVGHPGGHAWVMCHEDTPGFLWVEQADKILVGVQLTADGWRALQMLAREAEQRLRPVPWWRRWADVWGDCCHNWRKPGDTSGRSP